MAMIGTEKGCEVEKEELEVRVSSGLCELPPDLQRRIASFLFAGDKKVFRYFVSKSLMSNLGTEKIPIRPLPHPEIPYLVSLQAHNFLKFYHPTFMCSYRVQMQELSEARIRASNHGWLLMSTSDCDIFFFEPFSREKIQLPKFPVLSRLASLCFSSPPTSTDCFVLAVDLFGDEYNITRRGEANWTSYSFMKKHFGLSSGTVPLIHNGSCFCLGSNGRLGVFDLNEQQPKWRIHGKRYPKSELVHQSYLVARNHEELLRVLVLDDKKVRCSKFNIVTSSSWLKNTDLRDKMLFLSSTSSFMGSTELRGMYNNIYFPMFHEDALLFYSLLFKEYRSFHSDYSSKNCIRDVKDFYNNSAWIIPVSSDTLYNSSLRW